jgi:crotonobetainyl-CoA:carnitine CoA-transferase CaiB-like acyl-CoA transferase
LKAVNPGIVMVSSCLFGQTGPLAEFAGYGTMGAAMSGFFGLTGWPDRAPCGPFGAYTDYISPRFTVAVLLAALDHRRRTGEGQYIDFAQAEAGIHALAPAVLEYTINGRVWPRIGNDDRGSIPTACSPQGATTAGSPSPAPTDAQRSALAALVGGDDVEAIGAWTATRDADDAAEILQDAGVPAYAVLNSNGLMGDPQYLHRQHFREVTHPVHGAMTLEGTRFKMSRSLPLVDVCGPTLGQHTFDVLTEILGYDDERFTELLISGAIE